MKIVDVYNNYVTYEYKSFLEFIKHIKKNKKYFIGSHTEDDGCIYADFDRTMIREEDIPKDLQKAITIDVNFYNLNDTINQLKDNIKTKVNTETNNEKQTLETLIDLALQLKDKSWFMELTDRLKYYYKLKQNNEQ
jgi:uncharacterized protein YdcH (DUF465 family)